MARVVFFGTPPEALPSLAALCGAGHEVALVVTAPDAPAGRGQKPKAPPVKKAALSLGLPLIQPERASAPEAAERISAAGPDALVVVAFGQILSRSLLAVPRWGGVNVHFSLLPEWRGAAPLEHALLAGARRVGVSIVRMTAKMDAGPVLGSAVCAVRDCDDRGTLKVRLARLGADLLLGGLSRLERGLVGQVGQDHSRASYAPKVAEEAYLLDWSRPAEAVASVVRAASPIPGAWTQLGGRRLKFYCATVLESDEPLPAPGRVVAVVEDGVVVAAGDGALLLREGQLEGRKRMPGAALAQGLRLRPGDRVSDEWPPREG